MGLKFFLGLQIFVVLKLTGINWCMYIFNLRVHWECLIYLFWKSFLIKSGLVPGDETGTQETLVLNEFQTIIFTCFEMSFLLKAGLVPWDETGTQETLVLNEFQIYHFYLFWNEFPVECLNVGTVETITLFILNLLYPSRNESRNNF